VFILIFAAMADYPLPVFHFQVKFGSNIAAFSEVTGLTQEVQNINPREHLNLNFAKIKMPGLQKYPNITMKRGVFAGIGDFEDWVKMMTQGQANRRDLVISLVNENSEEVQVWTVKQAWPVKFGMSDQRARGTDVAIETIEFSHEGIVLKSK
jgi:phage tail-like protein